MNLLYCIPTISVYNKLLLCILWTQKNVIIKLGYRFCNLRKLPTLYIQLYNISADLSLYTLYVSRFSVVVPTYRI